MLLLKKQNRKYHNTVHVELGNSEYIINLPFASENSEFVQVPEKCKVRLVKII